MIKPREVPSRDDYYMGKAFWVASRSKDPRTQVGAVIVGADNSPIADGYNGPPAAMNDDEIDWDRPAKYPYIIHAEANAIKRSVKSALVGATLYVTAFPCKACMLDIADARIGRVVFFKPKTDGGSLLANEDGILHATSIAFKSGIELVHFKGDLGWMKQRMAFLEGIGIFDLNKI